MSSSTYIATLASKIQYECFGLDLNCRSFLGVFSDHDPDYTHRDKHQNKCQSVKLYGEQVPPSGVIE